MRTKILGHVKIVMKYLRFLIVGINQDRGREREGQPSVSPGPWICLHAATWSQLRIENREGVRSD